MFAQKVKIKNSNINVNVNNYHIKNTLDYGALSDSGSDDYTKGLSPEKPHALKLTSQPGSHTKNHSPSDRQDYLAMVTPMRRRDSQPTGLPQLKNAWQSPSVKRSPRQPHSNDRNFNNASDFYTPRKFENKSPYQRLQSLVNSSNQQHDQYHTNPIEQTQLRYNNSAHHLEEDNSFLKPPVMFHSAHKLQQLRPDSKVDYERIPRRDTMAMLATIKDAPMVRVNSQPEFKDVNIDQIWTDHCVKSKPVMVKKARRNYKLNSDRKNVSNPLNDGEMGYQPVGMETNSRRVQYNKGLIPEQDIVNMQNTLRMSKQQGFVRHHRSLASLDNIDQHPEQNVMMATQSRRLTRPPIQSAKHMAEKFYIMQPNASVYNSAEKSGEVTLQKPGRLFDNGNVSNSIIMKSAQQLPSLKGNVSQHFINSKSKRQLLVVPKRKIKKITSITDINNTAVNEPTVLKSLVCADVNTTNHRKTNSFQPHQATIHQQNPMLQSTQQSFKKKVIKPKISVTKLRTLKKKNFDSAKQENQDNPNTERPTFRMKQAIDVLMLPETQAIVTDNGTHVHCLGTNSQPSIERKPHPTKTQANFNQINQLNTDLEQDFHYSDDGIQPQLNSKFDVMAMTFGSPFDIPGQGEKLRQDSKRQLLNITKLSPEKEELKLEEQKNSSSSMPEKVKKIYNKQKRQTNIKDQKQKIVVKTMSQLNQKDDETQYGQSDSDSIDGRNQSPPPFETDEEYTGAPAHDFSATNALLIKSEQLHRKLDVTNMEGIFKKASNKRSHNRNLELFNQ